MRAMFWATVLTLLSAALVSGCLSGGEEASLQRAGTQEPASTVVVQPEPGVFVSENRAIVRGRVVSDANFNVERASVLLIGTEFFQETGRDGGFQLTNVTVGTHLLSVTAEGFHPWEQDIQTTPGNITEVVVHLLPKESSGAGYVPHIHDYWAGRTEVTLMDATVEYEGRVSEGNENRYTDRPLGMVYYQNTNSTNARYLIPIPVADPPNMVYPGTREIQVTFPWTTTDSTLTRMGLDYAPANSNTIVSLPRKASGAAHVIRISDPAMADNGHQRVTLWQF